MASNKEKARIVSGGAGGFLNPPTHPEHHFHVMTDLRRRPENRGSMSLESAAGSDWIDPATRAEARKMLRDWVPPPLSSAAISDWAHQVLGYFRSMYRNDNAPRGQEWNASAMHVDPDRDPLLNADAHAGVHFIRKFYPDYMPSRADFAGAYWGTRPGHSPNARHSRNASAPTKKNIETMLASYVETALWSSTDDDGNPLDAHYSVDDIADKALASMSKVVAAFAADNAADIDGKWEQAGNDFWLTRNGHGSGFWDGDWPEPASSRLTAASKAYGPCDLYEVTGYTGGTLRLR
jgi:hypothetical protein